MASETIAWRLAKGEGWRGALQTNTQQKHALALAFKPATNVRDQIRHQCPPPCPATNLNLDHRVGFVPGPTRRRERDL